ncbi:hypothetical protein [Brevundimonas sp.]|uniref:hypothetical protein n=1 Tax=Brevundimonas sp. TaxID=1871086 RepID=UPI003A8F278D
MKTASPYGRQMTLSDKRQFLKSRYYLMVGPLVLVLGVSLGSAEPSSVYLAAVAGLWLAVLTINRILP